MIDKFFIQTNDTILDFMSEIAKSKEVFSIFSGMEMDGYMVYYYAIPTEIVLVLIDKVDEGVIEKADKCVRWTEPYLNYFHKVLPNGTVSNRCEDSRLSPAMELYNHAWEMRRFFDLSCQYELTPAIHLMLLTNSYIINFPEVLVEWQQNQWRKNEFGFTVLHNLQSLRNIEYADIPVNQDFSLEASKYWTKWQKYLKNRGHFDWANPLWDDSPKPTDKRYRWNGEMGHLISDEFE